MDAARRSTLKEDGWNGGGGAKAGVVSWRLEREEGGRESVCHK